MSALQPTINDLAERFSEARIEIVERLADKLGLRDAAKRQWMQHHLEVTSSSRYWCIAFTLACDGQQRVLARLGNTLQRFDGNHLSAIILTDEEELTAERFRSSRSDQDAMALFRKAGRVLPLITTYCKAAREHAYEMAHRDVGNQDALDTEAYKAIKRLMAIRCKFHIKNLGAVLKDYCSHIDSEILHAVRSVGCPTSNLYNWLTTGDRQRRLQSLRGQRILVPLLVHNDGEQLEAHLRDAPWPAIRSLAETRPSNATILSVIVDQGLPLNDALAWLLSAKPAAIRALGKISPYHAGSALYHINREGKHEGWYALLAGASLGNRMPRKRADWETFIALWSAIPYQTVNALNMVTLLRGTPTDWADPAWQRITATIQHSLELFRQVNQRDGTNVLIDRRGIATKGLYSFFQHCTFNQLANLMNRFDRALSEANNAYKAETTGQQDLDHWPGLLVQTRALVAPNGCEIYELLSSDDLLAEHISLGHCINTYDRYALRGTCRLLSVRQAGVSIASIEIVQVDGQLELAQIQGPKSNSSVAPGSPAGIALTWFLNQLRSQNIPHNMSWPNLVPANYEQFMSESMVAWIKTSVGQP